MGERGEHGQDGQEEEDRRRIATQGPPQPPTPINHPNCLSWAHHWLPPDDPRRSTTLQTRAKRRVQQAWLQQWQASAPYVANPTSIEAPPGTDVLALVDGGFCPVRLFQPATACPNRLLHWTPKSLFPLSTCSITCRVRHSLCVIHVMPITFSPLSPVIFLSCWSCPLCI